MALKWNRFTKRYAHGMLSASGGDRVNWVRARRLAWILLGLSVTFGVVGAAFHWDLLSWLGIAALVVLCVIELAFDRCPHCRAFIGRGEKRYCSNCGKSLEV